MNVLPEDNATGDGSEGVAATIAIVIPAYQEAATIRDIVSRCRRIRPDAAVLVIDDGSTDATEVEARAAGAVVLRNAPNRGKGETLVRGLVAGMAMDVRYVVCLDADGQHRPEDMPRLLACAEAWPGRIVIGSRRAGQASAPRGRRVSNRVADFWVGWASGWPVEDSQSGFRVYPAEMLAGLRLPDAHGFAWESEMLIAAGLAGVRTVSVDIPTIYGPTLHRASHFRPVADIARIVFMVAGHLLRRGMHPSGLLRVLRGAATKATLLLSLALLACASGPPRFAHSAALSVHAAQIRRAAAGLDWSVVQDAPGRMVLGREGTTVSVDYTAEGFSLQGSAPGLAIAISAQSSVD